MNERRCYDAPSAEPRGIVPVAALLSKGVIEADVNK